MSKTRLDKNINIPTEIIKKLLTPSEIKMLKNRYLIAGLYRKGMSIRAISEKALVGTDTVVRTIRRVKSAGFLKPENIKSKTPWIFGKSNE
jgi:transposase